MKKILVIIYILIFISANSEERVFKNNEKLIKTLKKQGLDLNNDWEDYVFSNSLFFQGFEEFLGVYNNLSLKNGLGIKGKKEKFESSIFELKVGTNMEGYDQIFYIGYNTLVFPFSVESKYLLDKVIKKFGKPDEISKNEKQVIDTISTLYEIEVSNHMSIKRIANIALKGDIALTHKIVSRLIRNQAIQGFIEAGGTYDTIDDDVLILGSDKYHCEIHDEDLPVSQAHHQCSNCFRAVCEKCYTEMKEAPGGWLNAQNQLETQNQVAFFVSAASNLKEAIEHYLMTRFKQTEPYVEVWNALEHPEAVENAPAAILLSNIFGRYSWRYANRGYRYALIDSGHIGENLRLAARSARLSEASPLRFHDERLNALLEIDGRAEAVCALHVVGRPAGGAPAARPAARRLAERQRAAPQGLTSSGPAPERYHAATQLVPVEMQRNAAAANGKLFSPIRELPGSLYRSQISTRRSSPNRPTRSLIYRSKSGQALRSPTSSRPGLGTQPLLCTPGTGSSCLPR